MESQVTILYGSDTGTAQDYAVFLLKRLRYLQLKPTVAALDEFPLKKLVTDTKFLIVICATAGQGELPRNGRRFMKFLLKKKLPGDLLNHIFLTTFGLGDSSYPRFNYAIKKLHTRLMQLGCHELSLRCEADEQSSEGLDGYYSEWEYHLLEALKRYYPDMMAIDESTILPPQNVTSVAKDGPVLATPLADKQISISRINNCAEEKSLMVGKIAANNRITALDHFQDVRHVTISSNGLDYQPGDTIGLFPSNDPENVQALLELQPHWLEMADKPLKISGTIPSIEGGLIEDQYMTLRNLFVHHLDIMSIPTRSFFFSLWRFVDSSTEDGEREQAKLKEFCDFEASEDLYNYANRPRRLILETLLEFQNNLTIPLEHVFDMFPKIKPRLFSIASKPSDNSVELVIAIVEYQTIIKRIRKGLCTSWLTTLDVGDDIVFSVHKQGISFELPDNPNPPMILVGPGTGVAPMKSLIEYCADKSMKQEVYLFFGFRSEELDFMFKQLWESLQAQGKLTLFPCVSRSKTAKKQYVQNGIFEQAELVADLILNNLAILYVCGSSGPMPRQVRDTIVSILEKTLSSDEAQQYLHQLENSGRYIQETW